MPDKPEDYGEVVYRAEISVEDKPYAIREFAITKDRMNNFRTHLFMRGSYPDWRWQCGCGEIKTIRHLLSVIAEKDKEIEELKVIAADALKALDRDKRNLASAKRSFEAMPAWKQKFLREYFGGFHLNQPKEQHGKA